MTRRTLFVIAVTILLANTSLSTSFTVVRRTCCRQGFLDCSTSTELRSKHEAMRSIRDKRHTPVITQTEGKEKKNKTNVMKAKDNGVAKKELSMPSNSNGDISPERVDDECTIDVDLGSLEELEPLERQLIRLEGLEPYVLVSVLTATASYGTITNTATVIVNDSGTIDWIAAALLSSCMVSTLCGVYTTVVFSLCILYGKTALGMDREPTYVYFLDKTAQKRFRGFQTFSVSLLFFCVSILLLGVDKVPAPAQLPAALLSVGVVAFGFSEWLDITGAAVPIFTNVVPSEDKSNGK